MSVKAMSWVWDQDIPREQKFVLLAYADHADHDGGNIYPAVDTIAIGVDRDIGFYEENCRACGTCVLAYTAGVCPVTRCAKGLFNGPCGGTSGEHCEISADVPCAWNEIYVRLKAQNRLDDILKIQPPMEWTNQVQRTIVQKGYERRYFKG